MMRSVIVVVITAVMLNVCNVLSVGLIVENKRIIPRHNGPDAIGIRVGLDNEPKQDVDHIYKPDSLQMPTI